MNEIKKIIILTAAYYGREIKPEVVAMMAEDLADLDPNAVKNAYNAYRRNPKNRTMPLPAQIREIVSPVIDDEIEARDAAARIIQAISKYGHNNQFLAREFMGELAWSVVNKQGGWQNLCESFQIAQTGIWQAQFRDLAKTQLALAKAGRLDLPPALPASNVVQINAPTHQEKQRALAAMIKDLSDKNSPPEGA